MRSLPIRVFVGYDSNEVRPYHVLAQSIMDTASVPVSITPVRLDQLAWCHDRERHPLASTEFSISRFLVPFLSGYEGWSLFVDCDFLCRADLSELWQMRDDRYAVMVAKHDYTPDEDTKFLDQPQTKYHRKNWSSLILFNNARCRALTPEVVDKAPGLMLHRFEWLKDREIGEVPIDWNWLVGVYGYSEAARMVHFTLGGPYFSEYADCDYSREWWEAYRRSQHVTQTADIRAADVG